MKTVEEQLAQMGSAQELNEVRTSLVAGLAKVAEGAQRAALLVRLGHLLRTSFLDGFGALKCFQEAFKDDPSRLDAIADARAIYRDWGRLALVEKLLRIEIKAATQGGEAVGLYRELGDVLVDQGRPESAAEAYAECLKWGDADAGWLLEDTQTGELELRARVDTLLDQSADGSVDLLLRAAGLAKRFDASLADAIELRSYRLDPINSRVASLIEGRFIDSSRVEELIALQMGLLGDAAESTLLTQVFGERWALRRSVAPACLFLQRALQANPELRPATTYLYNVGLTEAGRRRVVLEVVEAICNSRAAEPALSYLLATAGLVALRDLKDNREAINLFARLSKVDPTHQALVEFREQVAATTETYSNSESIQESGQMDETSKKAAKSKVVAEATDEAATTEQVSATEATESSSVVAVDDAVIAELREKLVAAEKRPHEYVKVLVELADALDDPLEKADRYREAAEIYSSKGNAAEAVKVFESLLAVEPDNEGAKVYLRETYEKRRDWEKLIALMQVDAEALEAGEARTEAYREIARLATERIKKPELCVELWDVVLANDPDDESALVALVQLHERARDYEKLCSALERVIPVTFDEKERINYLTKLGQIAGDRLKDDERAAEAYRQLLVLSPDDKRAQEQLKKRYVTLGKWDDLETFFAESQNWDEFIRLLESNEGRAESTEQRVAMLHKAAELWMTQKGKPDRAARSLEKILSVDGENLEAAERLIPIYEQANNSKGLASVIEVKLNHTSDPAERLTLLLQIASIYEERLRDRKSALSKLIEAVALDPSNIETLDAAERVAGAAKAWEELVLAYQNTAESADHDAQVVLRLRSGRIFADELNRVEDALVEYRAVYDEYPENTDALSALEALYQKTEGWDDLLGVYRKKLDLVTDPQDRKLTRYSIAAVQRERMADVEGAIASYEEVLDEDEDDVTALSALDELYAETEAWDKHSLTLIKRVELADSDNELVELKFRLAQVQQIQMAQPEKALENYREVLLVKMDHSGARGALESLLENKQLRGESAAILESVFEQREDWQKLVQVLEVRAQESASPEEKVELLRKQASISATRLGSAEDAIGAQARALRAAPESEETRLELEQLANQVGALLKLAGIYQAIAEEVTDENLSLTYFVRVAEIHERLSAIDDAARAYEKALTIDPENASVLSAMDHLFREAKRWDALVRVYRKRIELATEPSEIENFYSEMAAVLELQLERPEDAVSAYQEVLGQLPQSARALGALEGLFAKLEKWSDLAENLESQLALSESNSTTIELTMRLASLREQQMSEVPAAIDGYREVLESDPTNLAALAALQRLFKVDAHEVSIAEILEPLYKSVGDFEKLIGVYEVQVRRSKDPSQQVELLGAISELQEDSAGDSAAAFDTIARALTFEPGNAETLSTLTRLAAATEQFERLGQILSAQALTLEEEPELAASLLMSAASVYEDNVGDANKAIELYCKVLDADPLRLEAAEALQTLYQSTGRYADMSAILQRKVEMLDDPEKQKEALYQAASLEEEVLERPDNAISVYEKILSLDEDDLRSVDALVSLLLGLSRWEELLSAYTRKVDLVSESDDKKQVLYEVGAVYERELKDVANAIDSYQRVLELDPDDLTALGRLDVLYQSAENWQELLSVLTREAELTADPEEAVGYQFRIASLYEKKLVDLERAVELYRELLGIQPEHQATLDALERLQNTSGAALAASAVLEQIYEAADEPEKLIGVLEVQVKHAASSFDGVQLLIRIASLQEERLGGADKAFETYSRAMALDSQNDDVLESFERLALITENWQKAASIYDAQLAASGDDSGSAVDLALRSARVYEDQLENVTAAIERYCSVLEHDPENRAALVSLDRLYEQTEQAEKLAEIIEHEAEIGESPEEILELKYRLGQVRQHQLRDIPGAILAYRDVVAAAPEHEGCVSALEELFENQIEVLQIAEILEPIYQAAADWEKLPKLREGQLAKTTNLDERVTLLQQMAVEAEEKLADVDLAFTCYVRALKEQPLNVETVDELHRLASVVDEGWSQLANAYSEIMRASGVGANVISSVGQRLAAVYEDELSDLPHAEQAFKRVLQAVPTDLVALENLDRIYSSVEQWLDLTQILEVRAQAVEDDFEKIDLYLRLGHTYEEHLAPAGFAGSTATRLSQRVEELTLEGPTSAEVMDADDGMYLSDDEEGFEPSLDDLMPLSKAEPELVDENVLDGVLEVGEIAESLAPPSMSETGEAYDRNCLDSAVRAYRVVFDELQEDNEDAIESLARVYALTEQWQELDAIFQRELDIASGDSAEADVRAKRAHLAADRLGNAAAAIEGWKRVLDLRGEDPEALRALALLYEAQGQWSELTDVLERHFDIADTDDDRVHVLTIRARLFDEQLNRDDEALETYQRVLDIDYSNRDALKAMVNIWRRRKNVDQLVSALTNLVESGTSQFEASELVEYFRELAKLYQEQLEQPFEAIDYFRKLLEAGPGDFEALQRLETLYRADDAWADIVDVKLQRAAVLPEPSEQIREYLEVTDMWRAQLHDYDKSVEAYDRILEIEPLHEKAFIEIERLHTAAERWEVLIEAYLNRLEHYEDVAARSDLLRRIARVFDEKLDDQNQAFDALVTAFVDDYFDDQTAAYLERMCQATERWGELITSANGWLQEEEDRKRKIQLSLRLGKWYGEDLGRPSDAMAYYQMVLELDRQNTRVMRQMAAIERLAGNYAKAGQMLNKALEAAVLNDDRKAILADLGELLHRHMDQADQAVPYFRRALEVDPLYLPALTALEQIYEVRGNTVELVKILTKKSDAIDRPDEAIRQKLRLGDLLENQLNDQEGAAKAYREALKIDDADLGALKGLERSVTRLEQWTELVQILERQLEITEIERDRVSLLVRLADVQEGQFLKADAAAVRLEQALEIDPSQLIAYEALERCYKRLKQYNDLISTYRRHLEETSDRTKKLELYLAIGTVFRDELGSLDDAIDAFQEVADADETNITALEALSKLFEKQGEAARAIEMMTRVAELTANGGQQVDMYFRIGRALEEKLSDRYGAREKFELALDLDPSHLPSLTALRTIAVDEADWDSACRYLEQEQAQTESARQRARLLVELGKIREDMLSEHKSSVFAYEEAIRLDSDCEEAAMPLVAEYGEQGRWADAAPLAEMLVRRSKNRERAEQHSLQKQLGMVMSKVGAFDKALSAYMAAHQLDLTDADTIRGVANAAFSLQDWPTALTNYQKVLTSLGEDEIEGRTEVYYRLGEIKIAQGQDRQAINNYEKALALDGEHRPSLEALVAAYQKSGEYTLVCEYKRQILDSVFDGEERFNMLMDIGDIWAGQVKQPLKALEAYEEARDLKPQDHALLHKMLQNYQAAEEWQKMVDILDSIMDLEDRPKVKAKLLNTQAQIYRDKLEDLDKSVELFNDALDCDPTFLEAFERINKVLTGQRNWKQLERSYRKMLHRIAGKSDQELEHNLWHQLGLIYRDRTGQTDEAIEAFRMSASLVAQAPVQRQILAELYEATENWDDAIKEQRRILKLDPLAPEPYLALYRLQLHKQAYDDAWCVASALSFMGKADADTERFFQDYRPQGMLPVTGRLGNEHWLKALVHEDENLHISKIFEMIAPAALQAKLALLRSQGKLVAPDERFRQDPATSTITFAKTFGWAGQVLGIAVPQLFVRNDVPGYIQAVPFNPPSSVAGQTVLSGFQPQELTFICGKHLTKYRPEHFLTILFPSRDELTIMLFAGVLLAAPQQPMPPDLDPHIRQAAVQLGQFMQPAHLEGLRQVVKQFLAAGAKANIKAWNQAVEHSACRAGLLLCGDLQIAKKIIAQEPQVPGGVSAQDKLKDLLIFSASIEYCALRKALGVAIQT